MHLAILTSVLTYWQMNMFNKEIRNRIRVSVAAYAYEYENDAIMEDSDYDQLSREIDTSIKTGNRKLDNFFTKHFEADTGMWVHKHPDLSKSF